MFMLLGPLATSKKWIFILLFFSAIISDTSQAYFPGPSFWKNRKWSLKFTSSSQAILAGNCSGVTTVASFNPSGIQANVSANITVNLTSTGSTTFYSDSACSLPISQITIASGSSSQNFYFVEDSVSSPSLTAAAPNFTEGNQSQTVSTNPFVWTGGGADNLWATGLNWSGGAAPNASQRALFNSACGVNCNAVIAANINVGGIRMAANYTGTITQNSGVTITMGSGGRGWVVLSGNFLGGNSTISMDQGLWIRGGSFTSTSGNLSFYSSAGGTVNFFTNSAPSQFSHNNGTLTFNGFNTSHLIDAAGTDFYRLNLMGDSISYNINNQAINVLDTFTLSDSATWIGAITNGFINVKGNLNITNKGKGGLGTLVINGPGAQVITTTASTEPNIPSLEYAKTAGSVSIAGDLRVRGNLTYTSGTVSDSGVTYTLVDDKTLLGGGKIWPKVIIQEGNISLSSGVFIVGDLLTLATTDDYTYIQNGTIELRGDLNVINKGKRTTSTGYLKLSGSTAQTVSSTAATQPRIGNFELANTSGGVSINGNLTIAGLMAQTLNWRHTSGAVSWSSGTLGVYCDGTGVNIFAGTMSYPNVAIQTSTGSSMNLQGSNWNIAGDFLAGDSNGGWPGNITNGTISVSGNVSFNQFGKYGNAVLQMVGPNSVTIQSTTNETEGTWTLNKPSATVSLAANLSLSSAGQGLNVLAGTLDMNGKNLSINGVLNISAGASVICNGGTISYGSLTNLGTLSCP